MNVNLSSLDRRKFLRGAGVALALPLMETFARAASKLARRKRLACFYLPDGVPMPLEKDPAFKDWSWFPHGGRKDFKLTKCMETLAPLRDELTVFSGLSNPALRRVHGHEVAALRAAGGACASLTHILPDSSGDGCRCFEHLLATFEISAQHRA